MKNELRRKIKNLRSELTSEQIENLSHKIFLNLKSLLKDIDAQKFFVYNSFGSEVKTIEIVEWLKKLNKSIYFPRVEQNKMVAVKLAKTAKFKTNKFGIEEPDGTAENIDNFVAIVPCLVLTKRAIDFGYPQGPRNGKP